MINSYSGVGPCHTLIALHHLLQILMTNHFGKTLNFVLQTDDRRGAIGQFVTLVLYLGRATEIVL